MAKGLLGLVLITAAYGLTRLPSLSPHERQELAAGFRFAETPLPEISGVEQRYVRPVNPSLQHISAWISSVGAAVALHDLDGDGLANDTCYVDTRTDQVIVTQVGKSPTPYAPFALDPGPGLFDRSTMCPTGSLPGDWNEDGLVDVLVYFWGRTPIVFLRREDGSEPLAMVANRYRPVEIVPGIERWFTNTATQADVDGDGHVDLVIGNYFPDGARILDASATVGDSMQHSMTRAYNGGRNRVLLWTSATTGSEPGVSFHDALQAFGSDTRVATAWTLAIGAADLDGDLLPELYFANDFGPDRLLHNRSRPGNPEFVVLSGQRKFTTPRSKVLGHDSFKGMGVDFADVNQDGQLDLYVSNIAEAFALQESHLVFVSDGDPAMMRDGIAPYTDQSEQLGLSRGGWSWDARLADFNNDGILEAVQATGFVRGKTNRWPELHEVAMGNDQLLAQPACWHHVVPGDDLSGNNPNSFYVRSRSGRYYNLSHEVGLDAQQITRGIAIADIDGDGDLDFAVGNQWEPSRLYVNQSSSPNRFLELQLKVPVVSAANNHARGRLRWAIGAQVRVELPDRRVLVGQVDGGSGHSGKRSPELHWGLGDVNPDQSITVEFRWRDETGRIRNQFAQLRPGRHQVVLDARVDQIARK